MEAVDKLLNVLIVEASTEGADLIVDELKRGGYEPVIRMVETNQAVSSILREQIWDIIVIDLETPGFDTVEALGEVRGDGACPPVIVVSGAADMRYGACLMRAGARDFIKKDDFARFLPAVERELNEYQGHYNQELAETALQESEDNFQVITEAAPVGLAIAGYQDGKVLYANPLACQIFGVPDHKIIGSNVLDLYERPEDGLKLAKKLEKGGAPHEREMRMRRPDGTPITISVSMTPMVFRGKKSILSSFRDITERKKRQSASECLVAAIDTLSESVVICDADDRIVFYNKSWAAFNQKALDGIGIGSKYETFVRALIDNDMVPEAVGREEEWFQQRLERHCNPGEAFEAARQDGKHLLARIEKLPDGGRAVLAYDITEKRIAEENRQMLEVQLRQSQKTQTIGTLANGIAHDFNNVLSPIMGYVELALQDIPADWLLHQNLLQVRLAAERARELVRQILVVAGHAEQEQQPVQVMNIVQETLKFLRPSLPSTIEIRLDLDEACEQVRADPTQIHQVVMNLCTNAYQAMTNGGILEISARMVGSAAIIPGRQITNDWQYVDLRISDTGSGMDPKQMKRIFEPFYTTKEVGVGTGLGLSVVHGIITAHGGAITVESRLGEGSTFHVFLPAIQEAIAGEQVSNEVSNEPGNERVLYVDDEEEIAEMGQQILERLGYRVTVAHSAREALAAVQEAPEPFDIVLTDHTMPQMTGIELAENLLLKQPDLPILLMSGSGEAIKMARENGINIRASLMKPVALHELSAAIRSALETPYEPKEANSRRFA